MNAFQDLARRVDDVTAPTVDVDGLIARGEQRLHRRRMTTVLAAVAAVAAIAVGGSVLQQSIGPVNQPDEDKTNQTDRNKAPEHPGRRHTQVAPGFAVPRQCAGSGHREPMSHDIGKRTASHSTSRGMRLNVLLTCTFCKCPRQDSNLRHTV